MSQGISMLVSDMIAMNLLCTYIKGATTQELRSSCPTPHLPAGFLYKETVEAWIRTGAVFVTVSFLIERWKEGRWGHVSCMVTVPDCCITVTAPPDVEPDAEGKILLKVLPEKYVSSMVRWERTNLFGIGVLST